MIIVRNILINEDTISYVDFFERFIPSEDDTCTEDSFEYKVKITLTNKRTFLLNLAYNEFITLMTKIFKKENDIEELKKMLCKTTKIIKTFGKQKEIKGTEEITND